MASMRNNEVTVGADNGSCRSTPYLENYSCHKSINANICWLPADFHISSLHIPRSHVTMHTILLSRAVLNVVII